MVSQHLQLCWLLLAFGKGLASIVILTTNNNNDNRDSRVVERWARNCENLLLISVMGWSTCEYEILTLILGHIALTSLKLKRLIKLNGLSARVQKNIIMIEIFCYHYGIATDY